MFYIQVNKCVNRPLPSCILFDLNGLVSKTDFHMKGFASGLVLKRRQRELGNDLFILK